MRHSFNSAALLREADLHSPSSAAVVTALMSASATPGRPAALSTPTRDPTRSQSATPAPPSHSRDLSFASTVSAPSSPTSARDLDNMLVPSSASAAGALPSPSTALVLHGPELLAFTSALREMIRTNHVRATRQAAINETNQQLHAMNLFLNYANRERTQQLEREYTAVRNDIETGRQLLAHMSQVIASQDEALTTLGSHVTTLSMRADEQSERVAGIEDAMIEQKAQLAQAMAEYEARLSAQEAEFRRQEAVLARLLSVRFKLDFGLDVLMLLLGWYASHNAITATVFTFLSNNVFFRDGGRRMRNRRGRQFTGVVQFLLFVLLVRKFKQLATQNGLHHAIGGYGKYLEFAARTAGTAVEMVRGGGRAATTLDEDEERALQESASAAAAGSAATAASPSAATSSPSSIPPEYRISDASHLGRRVGGFMLDALSTGRDTLRFVLARVVGSGASAEMDFDVSRSANVRHQTPTVDTAAVAPAAATHSEGENSFTPAAFVPTRLADADGHLAAHFPAVSMPNPSAPPATDDLQLMQQGEPHTPPTRD